MSCKKALEANHLYTTITTTTTTCTPAAQENLFRGSGHSVVELTAWSHWNGSSNSTKPVVVGLPLVFEGEPAIGDVVEVLQPFKVGDGDTFGVDVHVGDDQATVGLKDLVSTRGLVLAVVPQEGEVLSR